MQSPRKEEWEQFRSLGLTPPGVRDLVAQSWHRATLYNLPETRKRAPLIDAAEFPTLHRRNGDLLGASREIVARHIEMLRENRTILVLCDARGVVLEADGSPDIVDRAQDDRLLIGGCWNEAAIGTNAIGTALHIGKPVQISGAEHFCENIQKWSCAAAPIHHPATGALMGVLDITGPSTDQHAYAAALSIAIAGQVTAILNATLSQEHAALLDAVLGRDKTDGFVLFDRFGRCVRASSGDALAYFDPQVCERISGLARHLQHQPDHRIAAEFAAHIPGADAEIIYRNGQQIGLLAHLRRQDYVVPRIKLPAPSRKPQSRIGALTPPSVLQTPTWKQLRARARDYLIARVPLVLTGESGTGKETLAGDLATAFASEGPVEVLHCATLTAQALRRDLAPGGALYETCRRGGLVVLLDPAETAPDLLHLLTSHLALGAGQKPRLLSVSPTDPETLVKSGRVRRDVYDSLIGAQLGLPPLRDQRAEILPFARVFAEQAVTGSRRRPIRFTPAAQRLLNAYDWPGNLKELRNLVQALSVTSQNRLVDVPDLPLAVTTPPHPRPRAEALRERERADIEAMIDATGGNLSEAARRLGIARSTLYLKLESFGLRPARTQ
ncbi:sigma-54-dependent Fis family transcriptional regulator [Actibacterium sp.]|uniref:sigma-54-dependent Fis family transcriptional regulator n=1 Tax=Actibacterium sp. TaxID=1872125 RepID=UPI00356405D3